MNVIIKSYLESQMSLEDKINNEGFVFLKYKTDPKVKEEFLNLEKNSLNSKGTPGFGGNVWETSVKELLPYSCQFYEDLLNTYDLPKDYLFFDLEKIKKEDYHFLHTHFVPARYQICIWIPLDDSFKGREFVYGTQDNLKKFRPSFGDLVIFKPNDTTWVHGTTPLLTDIPVYSIGITSSFVNYRVKANDFIITE